MKTKAYTDTEEVLGATTHPQVSIFPFSLLAIEASHRPPLLGHIFRFKSMKYEYFQAIAFTKICLPWTLSFPFPRTVDRYVNQSFRKGQPIVSIKQ